MPFSTSKRYSLDTNSNNNKSDNALDTIDNKECDGEKEQICHKKATIKDNKNPSPEYKSVIAINSMTSKDEKAQRMYTKYNKSTTNHAHDDSALVHDDELDKIMNKHVPKNRDKQQLTLDGNSIMTEIESRNTATMSTNREQNTENAISSSQNDSSMSPSLTKTSPEEIQQRVTSGDIITKRGDNPHSRRDDEWLEQCESDLRLAANNSPYVTREQLKDCFKVKKSYFMNRLVDIAHDKDGRIAVERLIDQLRALVRGSQTDKLRVLFNVHDSSGSGDIDRRELQQFFTSVIDECNLDIDRESIQELIDTFLHTADKDNDGAISFEELQIMFQRRPSLINNMTVSSMVSSKAPNGQPGLNLNAEMQERSHFRHFSRNYIRNNLKKVIALTCYGIINACLMGYAIYRYWDSNHWMKVARAFGKALNFNCTLVLVLMLRRTITWLRNTPLRNILPFDQHIFFHRLCGYLIAIMSVGHVIGHVGNSVYVSDNINVTVPEILFTTKAGIGWVGHSAYITGDILVVVLLVMVILSLPMIRRSGFFEVFYWSHKLYLVFWVVLILHGPDFYKWFVGPGAVFVIELVIRNPLFRMFSLGKTYIERVYLLPSGVTHLVISRPPGFQFKPGDYVFIQVPAVAKYETHPFTISSAPENMEEIWLHVRTAGHWTKSMHKYFTDYTPVDVETGVNGRTNTTTTKENNDDTRKGSMRRRRSSLSWLKSRSAKASKVRASMQKRVVMKKVKVRVHIDGPYGTASRQIFEQEHAVLIGSGIGITPFASIIQSIVSRYKTSCVQCPRCSHKWCHETPASVMALKKVDYVWINRDQRQFEWFASMLVRLEREQEVEGGLGGILDMHMYMTSLPAKTDMRGMGLQLALDLMREDDNRDLLTGLRTKTQGGRPDFDELFSKIKAKSEGLRVKVYFCGSPLLGTTVKLYSAKYDFAFAHEYF